MHKLIGALLLVSSVVQAQTIETVIPKKGYILSLDIQDKQCKKIWSKQIPLFKKNNPKIKDPNILSIGKSILVQNCRAPEVVVAPVVEEIAKPIPVKEESNDKSPFFVELSGVYHKTASKGDDSDKDGYGYKIAVGHEFDLGKNTLKLSLGYLATKSTYSYQNTNGLSFERRMVALESSYMKSVSSKLKLGPSLGLLYSPIGTSYKDPAHSDRDASLTLGGEAEYSLNKHFVIELKLNNQIEDRLNLMSTLGIQYKF